ncbi:hypothetical protein CDAR_85351 [Caerostris darwini]|uniref:Transmembrane protein n=1 Tax=Caerostris darwini TaxID=1538125 RepID=A0AAV4UHE0_9ARAC|nr:hypothetical protein CDAR_85351 [Caerostris darwini]
MLFKKEIAFKKRETPCRCRTPFMQTRKKYLLHSQTIALSFPFQHQHIEDDIRMCSILRLSFCLDFFSFIYSFSSGFFSPRWSLVGKVRPSILIPVTKDERRECRKKFRHLHLGVRPKKERERFL